MRKAENPPQRRLRATAKIRRQEKFARGRRTIQHPQKTCLTQHPALHFIAKNRNRIT